MRVRIQTCRSTTEDEDTVTDIEMESRWGLGKELIGLLRDQLFKLINVNLSQFRRVTVIISCDLMRVSA